MTTQDAESIIKAHMGYTEGPAPACKKCKFLKEKADQQGGWFTLCELNPCLHFGVRDDARCNYFEAKP
jgi:hypothetical protein